MPSNLGLNGHLLHDSIDVEGGVLVDSVEVHDVLLERARVAHRHIIFISALE